MEVEVLTRDGEILFIEARSDFAKLLLDLLSQPLGAVVAVADDSPLANLQGSLAELHKAIPSNLQEDTLPSPIDLGVMMQQTAAVFAKHAPLPDAVNLKASSDDPDSGYNLPIGLAPPICNMVTVKGTGPWTLVSHGVNFCAMVAFTGIVSDSFEMTVRCPIPTDTMLGFAPADSISTYLGTQAIYLMCGFYLYCEKARLSLYGQDGTLHKPSGVRPPAVVLSLRYTVGEMSCSCDNGPYTPLKFATQIPGTVQYSPIVVFCEANKMCTIDRFVSSGLEYGVPDVTQSAAPRKSTFNFATAHRQQTANPMLRRKSVATSVATFLISNDLVVCGSSSTKAAELFQKQNVDRSHLEASSVVVTPEHIQKMLSRVFLGQHDALQHAFGDIDSLSINAMFLGGASQSRKIETDDQETQTIEEPAPEIETLDQQCQVSEESLGIAKRVSMEIAKHKEEKAGNESQVANQEEEADDGGVFNAVLGILGDKKPGKADAGKGDRPMTKQDLLEALDAALSNETNIYQIAAKHWKKHAEYEESEGRPALKLKEAQALSSELAKDLKVPAEVFSSLEELFMRFDFNGNSLLDKKEWAKLVYFAILQKRKLRGGRSETFDIPQITLEERGYSIVRLLGVGGQGSMYLIKREGISKQYCIKCYDKNDDNSGGIDAILEEYHIMEDLEHKNVCRTYEMFQDDGYWYLVNEPYFGGDLTKLHTNAQAKGVAMTENWWRDIFRQVLDGLTYLHSQAVCHCDIKEPNIMVAFDDSFKAPRPILIDLGLAQFFADTTNYGEACGTPGYIPPEVLERAFWSPRGDVFSTGIVFFQLLAYRIPGVPDDNMIGVLQCDDIGDDARMEELAKSGPLPWDEFPGKVPELKDLIEKMTCRNELQRLRVAQCADHAWFSCGSNSELKTKAGPKKKAIFSDQLFAR